MRHWIKRVLISTLAVLGIGFAFSWWAVKQTQHVPEFYQRATSSADGRSRLSGQVVLETAVSSTGDRVGGESVGPQAKSWTEVFTVDEINAWLTKELPTSFPQLLAQGATDPRICIENGRVLAAARYRTQRFDMVISCELEVELTAEPNMLALRVKHLRAGSLPLPLTSFLTGISKEAAKGDVDIRWDDTEAGPVALVKVPCEHPRYVTTPVLVESVRLVDGALVLAGNTGPLAFRTFRPHGPLYQFVSYRPTHSDSDQPADMAAGGVSEALLVR
jgi:hypothetical protein